MGLSRTVSEIDSYFSQNSQNFPSHPCILHPRWWCSPWNWVSVPGAKKLEWWGYQMVKKVFKMGLAILKQYQRMTDTQSASHIGIAKTALTYFYTLRG